MAQKIQQTISPIDGRVVVERPLAGEAEVEAALTRARRAQRAWSKVPLEARIAACGRMVDAFVAERDAIAEALTLQMGRPIAHTPGEVRGLEARARAMMGLAEQGLARIEVDEKPGYRRYVAREPLGVVFVIAPWNYPYLTAVNVIVPAILAGNAVLLKHSAQTPLCAERFGEAFARAGLPEGVFQYLHLSHEATQGLVRTPGVDFVAFTGSVEGGRAIEQAAAGRFIGVGLELGGKDPAYVRADADLAHAAESLVDGAFFNAGQSCCGIERVYVDARVYDEFVERACSLTKAYVLGDPRSSETTLGPMVRASAARFVRAQIAEAIAAGAKAHVPESLFPASREGTPYLAPQLLTEVDRTMRVMQEETFGPLLCVTKVRDDEEALRLMNESRYGLSASVYTRDLEVAEHLGRDLEAGTIFMNRCDYLDPELAWTGVKDSGRGATLGLPGFAQLTRLKSYHLKLVE